MAEVLVERYIQLENSLGGLLVVDLDEVVAVHSQKGVSGAHIYAYLRHVGEIMFKVDTLEYAERFVNLWKVWFLATQDNLVVKVTVPDEAVSLEKEEVV